jgi:hypothetical protein
MTALVASAQLKPAGFLIDSTKDYAYLKFDHFGDRRQLAGDTASKGLWIRLVNNCRVPLVVATFDPGTGDPGVGVYDEVIPVVAKGPRLRLEGIKNAPSQPSTAAAVGMPQGYSLPDVFSTTRISPGESLLFNVPANHVGPSWSIQVQFYLAPSKEAYGSGPYSVLSFDWVDIPEQFRAAWERDGLPSVAQEPKEPSSMLLHESGHADPLKQP